MSKHVPYDGEGLTVTVEFCGPSSRYIAATGQEVEPGDTVDVPVDVAKGTPVRGTPTVLDGNGFEVTNNDYQPALGGLLDQTDIWKPAKSVKSKEEA